jgi:hypothetical protein
MRKVARHWRTSKIVFPLDGGGDMSLSPRTAPALSAMISPLLVLGFIVLEVRCEMANPARSENKKQSFFLVIRLIVQSVRIIQPGSCCQAEEIRKQFQNIPYVRG